MKCAQNVMGEEDEEKREKRNWWVPIAFFFLLFYSSPYYRLVVCSVLYIVPKANKKTPKQEEEKREKNHRWRWKRFFACFVSTDSELSTKKRNESNIDVLFFFHQNVFYQYKIALTIKQRGLDSDSVERKNNCQSNWCWQ
jgi:hypothetical protein